jgi:ribosomal protein L35
MQTRSWQITYNIHGEDLSFLMTNQRGRNVEKKSPKKWSSPMLLLRIQRLALRSCRLTTINRPSISLIPLMRLKSDEITIRFKKDKKPKSKRLKLKNHKGAMARWMVVGFRMFKRSQCGRSHLNRKNRAMKKVFLNNLRKIKGNESWLAKHSVDCLES